MTEDAEARRSGLLPIRMWRMQATVDGVFIYFDPRREHVRLFEGVDPDVDFSEVDKPGSVSALDEDEDGYIQDDLFMPHPFEDGAPSITPGGEE